MTQYFYIAQIISIHIILCDHSFIITVENRSKDEYLFLGEIKIEKKNWISTNDDKSCIIKLL